MDLDVQKYLTEKGFPIYYSKDMEEVTNHAIKVLREPDKYRVDTRRMLQEMESPIDAINRILKR
jgi:predicted glycosyltransferase